MKTFRSFGFAGDDSYDVIEADSQEEAEDIAWSWAIERVNSWAELIEESIDD